MHYIWVLITGMEIPDLSTDIFSQGSDMKQPRKGVIYKPGVKPPG